MALPYTLFDHFVALARGLDLDDDDDVRTRAAQDISAGQGTAAHHRTLGVLFARAGDYPSAVGAFAQAQTFARDAVNDELGFELEALLEAWARVRAGDPNGALAVMDVVLARHTDDRAFDGVPPTEPPVFDLLGNLAQHSEGRHDEARAEASQFLASRWSEPRADRACAHHVRADALALLQRDDDADDGYCLAGATSLWARLDHARFLAARGRIDDARSLIATIPDSAYEVRARIDLDVPPKPLAPDIDVGWLDAYPALARLVADNTLRAAGFVPVDAAEGKALGDALEAHYQGSWHLGVLWSDALFSLCAQQASAKVCIAKAPPMVTAIGAQPHVYACLADPDRVFILSDPLMPAALGVEVSADPGVVARALDALVVRRRVPRAQLLRHTRAMLGYPRHLGVPNPYTGGLDRASPLALERHFAFSPTLRSEVWGSAFADDPYPERLPPQPQFQLKVNALVQMFRQQRPGGVCSFTRRTCASRSHIGVELHGMHLYVADLRYLPNPFPEVVEAFNASLGTRYPTELPVDVVAALHGFDWLTAADLEQRLVGAGPELMAGLIEAIAAVGHDDAEATQERLLAFVGHDAVCVRSAVFQAARTHLWPSLLDALKDDPDPDLHAVVELALRFGFAVEEYDHLGEPLGLAEDLATS